MHSPIFRLIFILLFLALAVGLVYLADHEQRPYHLATVTPRVLYRSGNLPPKSLDKVLDQCRIRTLVDLCMPYEKERWEDWDWALEEERICREKDVNLVNIPIVSDTPPNEEQISEWLSLLLDKNAHPILVHCRHGVVRTGMLVAVYEMEFSKKSNEEAFETLAVFGHPVHKDRYKSLRDFIRDYVPRLEQEIE